MKPNPPPAYNGNPRRRHRWFIAGAAALFGICEFLSTSPGWDGGWLLDRLGTPIATIGFLTFVILVGPFGNALVAAGSLWIVWRRWRWPAWSAALLSAPFWIVTYRAMPKPW